MKLLAYMVECDVKRQTGYSSALELVGAEAALNDMDSSLVQDDLENMIDAEVAAWNSMYSRCLQFRSLEVQAVGLLVDSKTGTECVIKNGRFSFLRGMTLAEEVIYAPEFEDATRLDDETIPRGERHRENLYRHYSRIFSALLGSKIDFKYLRECNMSNYQAFRLCNRANLPDRSTVKGEIGGESLFSRFSV
jgi:hypothetical protein